MSMETCHKPRTLTSTVYNIFQSLLPRVLAVGVAYASGYFKLNPFLIMVVWGLLKYRNQKKLEKMFKLEAAMSISQRNDRTMVIDNVNPTPAWVFFPDSERCEWINKIVSHLWPTVRPWLIDYGISIFEPSINESLSAYMKKPNFNFENCSLGTIPPRISGVRVYKKGSGDQIMIDIHCYFSSDSTFSFSLMNAKGGIENFKIKGCLRTIILPVTKSTSHAPLIGGVELIFLRQPTIDFKMSGVLEVLGIPGLNGILREAIDSKIYESLVLPNKVLVKVDDRADYETLKFPDPVGLLRINVIEAIALEQSDRFIVLGSRKPDTSVTITFGSKTYMSEIVENSRNPMWNFWAEFIVDCFFDDTITISVNKGVGNLGTLSLGLKLVKDMTAFDSWIQLEGTTTGMVHVRAWYYHISSNPKIQTSDDMLLLEVFLKNAINLDSKSKIRNSVAILCVGDVTRKSRPVPIEDAAFEEVFSFLVKNPITEKLRVKLIDEGGKINLGETDFEIKDLLTTTNMEIINELLKLKNKSGNSALFISARLRILKTAQNFPVKGC